MTGDDLPSVAAIDFETANRSPRSAVSLGLVLMVGGAIVERFSTLIRPPTRHFTFTRIHGLAAHDVADAPDFAAIWPTVAQHLRRARVLAAHHAAFDQAVLAACCSAAGLTMPRHRVMCTVALSRETWGLTPTRLPDVCRYLGIPLRHHDAAADAEACAHIVRAAWSTETGRRWILRLARE